jgi:hypothetical protein
MCLKKLRRPLPKLWSKSTVSSLDCQREDLPCDYACSYEQAPGAAHGIGVDDQGNGTVTEQRLYQPIRQPKPIADRQFEIEFLDSGVGAFAFTFG